jgi:lipopolysaccharide export system permease protein
MTLFAPTFSRYLAKQFFWAFLAVLAGLVAVILLFEVVELLHRAEKRPNVGIWVILGMGLLKIPDTGQRALPFAILFAAQFLFWRMTRSNELVVARALGVSAWRFLAPIVSVAVLVAVGKLVLFNPIAAVMANRFDHLENIYLHGRTSAINVSTSGLWLRQARPDGGVIIVHARGMRPADAAFLTVSLFFTDAEGNLDIRLDAEEAFLEPGQWNLQRLWVNKPQQPTEWLDRYTVPTELTLGNIEESLASPEALPFWSLPHFIETLKATGLSARKHELFFHSQLAAPLLYTAMVLFAAAFANRLNRGGGTMRMISAGLVTGLSLFVVNDVVLALGQSATLPVVVAAWFPAGIAMLVALVLLLFLEEG